MSYPSRFLFVKIVFIWCWVLTYLTPLITGDNKTPSHTPQVIAPHCSDRCGNISIPYPFGIEEGCFYEESPKSKYPLFRINCTDNHTHNPPKPILGNLEVLEISVLDGEFRTKLYVSYDCYNYSESVIPNTNRNSVNLVTFTLSSTKNILVAIGCDTYAWFRGHRHGKNYSSGCMTTCLQQSDVISDDNGECSGIGCCQAPFPTSSQYINVTAKSFENHTWVYDFNPCSVAFPVAKDAFKFNRKDLGKGLDYYETKEQPVVIDWTIGNKTCSEAKADGSCLCKQNAVCHDAYKHKGGYRCKCKAGYFGNPYLPHGCTDIDECRGENNCEKAEYCFNTNGGHYCKCPKGVPWEWDQNGSLHFK